MATITAPGAASTAPTRANVAETCLYAEFDLATDNGGAALALNDVIQMMKVPSGFTVTEVLLTADDLDTGGSPAIILDVGDDGDTDRFIDGSDVGQAGAGVSRLDNPAGHQYTFTADNTIDVLVQAAPATGATAGKIYLTVMGTMAQALNE